MTSDYVRLIDSETWNFIRTAEAHYPPDAVAMDVEGQRAAYERLCRAFRRGRPEGVETCDIRAKNVPMRLYVAGEPTASVLYLHGGGYVVGSLESHDDICTETCAVTGFRVLAVDYRLAPEHAHPAPFEDASVAVEWLAREFGQPIVLAGDSAGGNLAAALAHWTRNRPEHIIGQVLVYPSLGGERDRGSYVVHAEAPMLTTRDIDYYESVRHHGRPPMSDPTCAPLKDPDFSGLPPTVVFTAECDPLSDDGRNYCDRIRAAGGQAHWVEEPGLVHGYLRARATVKRAGDSFERIETAIESLGQGLWTHG